MTKIKICGLSRERDIDYVNQYIPDYVGFVMYYPKSRRNVSPEKAADLVRLLNPGIYAVGVIVDQPFETAAALLNDNVVDILQLHGNEDPAYITALQQCTGKQIWKAFKIASKEDLEAAAASPADMIVLDSGKGSGEPFDWSLLEGFTRPYFLAGGLAPGNVIKALNQAEPYGVDLSTGVETNGVKDKGKISSVIAAIRKRKKGKGEPL